jgi:hypothetical protein
MSRVWGVIQDITAGTLMDRPAWPQTVVQNAPQIDPATGQPALDPNGSAGFGPTPTTMLVPNWMPTENDSIPIWKRMFGDWMKTQEFADLDVSMQDMANKVWQAIEMQEQQKAAAGAAGAAGSGDAARFAERCYAGGEGCAVAAW